MSPDPSTDLSSLVPTMKITAKGDAREVVNRMESAGLIGPPVVPANEVQQ